MAELVRLLLQVWGGGATIWIVCCCHADMRIVVGLQVHGRDVTYFTIVSVEKDKTKNVGQVLSFEKSSWRTNPGLHF